MTAPQREAASHGHDHGESPMNPGRRCATLTRRPSTRSVTCPRVSSVPSVAVLPACSVGLERQFAVLRLECVDAATKRHDGATGVLERELAAFEAGAEPAHLGQQAGSGHPCQLIVMAGALPRRPCRCRAPGSARRRGPTGAGGGDREA